MSPNVGLNHTQRVGREPSRFADVLAGGAQPAAAERVLLRTFWLPAPSTAPATPIDLAEARARR